MNYAIALDLGTTAIKASLIDEIGRVQAVSSYECTLETPAPNQVEQDPAAWYEHACRVIREALGHTDPRDVLGVGVTSQGISFTLTDESFLPLCRAVSWLDTRAKDEAGQIEARYPGQALFAMTGKCAAEGYTLPALLWLLKRDPALMQRARHCLMPMDYAIARMTGKAVSDRTMWAGSLLLDIHTQDWNESMLRAYGIDPALLPVLQDTGSVAGGLTAEAADLTGLMAGTPVIGAGQDQKTAAYGASIRRDMATLSLGTAGAMEALTAQHALDYALGVSVCPYISKGSWIIETCISTAGAAIKWVKNSIFPDISYCALNALCDEAPIGSNGVFFLPFLTSPGTPHRNKTLDGGYRALTLNATRADLARALYEGLAYELRLNTDALARAGVALSEITAFGGASRSEPFCRILADVCNLPIIKCGNEEMTGVGAAKMVFAHHGYDLDRFSEGALGGTTRYEPKPANADKYRALYQNYCALLNES